MKKLIRISAVMLSLVILAVSVSVVVSGYHSRVCHDGETEYVVTHLSVSGSHCRLCQLSTLISAALRHIAESQLFIFLFCSFAVFIILLCNLAESLTAGSRTLLSLKVRLNN